MNLAVRLIIIPDGSMQGIEIGAIALQVNYRSKGTNNRWRFNQTVGAL